MTLYSVARARVTIFIVILIVESIYMHERHMFTSYLLPTHNHNISYMSVKKIDSKITSLNQVMLSYTICPNDYRPK